MTTVYKYTNRNTPKVYIGKTTQDLTKRHKQHVWKAHEGTNTVFGKAIRKYGIESFDLEVLCEVDDELGSFVEMLFIEALRATERQYGYNMTAGGEGMTDHHHSVRTKEAIRQKMTGRAVTDDFRKKIGELKTGNTYCLGLKRTPEQCEGISKRLKGNKYALGNVLSFETRQHMSKAAVLREAAKRLLPPRTHCGNGHEQTPDNVYVWNSKKSCDVCRRLHRQKK